MRTQRGKLKDLLINGPNNSLIPNNLLILGMRGLGKSTFVLDTISEMENVIYLQLQILGGGDAEELKLYLCDECNDNLNLPEEVTPANLLSIIKKYKITIVLDEWEMLLEQDLMTFFIELLNLKTRVILVGLHSFAQLVNQSQLMQIEPHFIHIQMPPFARTEAFDLMNNSGLTMTNEAKNFLHNVTKGHGRYLAMFLVDLRCKYLGETITESHINQQQDKVKKSIYWCDPLQKNGESLMLQIAPAQQLILAKVAEGKTDQQIAECLSIHPGTVRNQIAKICDRLGVKRGDGKRKMRRGDLIHLCAEYSMFNQLEV